MAFEQSDVEREIEAKTPLYRRLMAIVAFRNAVMEAGDEQFEALARELHTDSEARVFRWQRALLAHLHTVPTEQCRRLERSGWLASWDGTDKVTDINEFRHRRSR